MPAGTNFEEERAELTALLSSGVFTRAPGLAQMLGYVCQKYFDGRTGEIKEYNIAVEALGRPPEFDQKRDSIVRVEAHRLRKRLKEYYERDGAHHAVQIQIPSGQYAPSFIVQNEAALVAQPPQPLEELQLIRTVEGPAGEYSAPRPLGGRVWTAVALGLIVLGAALVAVIWRDKQPQSAALSSAPLHLNAPQNGEQVRILAGSDQPYTDRFGRHWEPDRNFVGGSKFSDPNHPIFGTRDPVLYRTRREGAFEYNIPLKPGCYELRLHFAETLYGESNIAGGGETTRLFNIRANGKIILESLDVIGDGGSNTADVRVFKNIWPAPDGLLHLAFEGVTSLPFLNAIEITPGEPGRLRPIRIVARDQPFTDHNGQEWESDRYVRGGQLVFRPHTVTGTEDPEMYRGERFGNLTYVVPVAAGQYSVTLHFSETWFGPDKPPLGGVGSRVFDVLCNGLALARHLDITREAGGGDRALVRKFRGIEASPQGKLVLSFVPVRNYACVNAIEIVDEARAPSS